MEQGPEQKPIPVVGVLSVMSAVLPVSLQDVLPSLVQPMLKIVATVS